MILPIVKYGHPALRQKGDLIKEPTDEVLALIDDMFDTMYDAQGIGLAAQQVGVALQLTVIDVREVTDRPSTLHIDGQPADVDGIMPLVLINPELTPGGDPDSGPEGCLSFPEIFTDITRPENVHVKALNEKLEPIEFDCGGLLARAIQHETDHLHGILFIDRMTSKVKEGIRAEIEQLQAETKASLE